MTDLQGQAREALDRDGEGSRRSTGKPLALALAPGTAFLLFFVWRAGRNPFGQRRFTLFDDAMISMTYARTLADTGRLVWFPGAAEVQGFTNPLWTLYMAGLHWIGLEGSSAALAVSLTGVLLILGSAVVVYALVAQATGARTEARIFGAVAAGAVPFMYPLAYWTLRGMEVGLLAFVVIVCIWCAPITRTAVSVDRRTVMAGLAGAVGVLTRFDFAILLAGMAACCAVWAQGWRLRLRMLATLVGPASVAAVCLLLFQRVYYGDWLPNTYRLKMDGVTLHIRLFRGVFASGKVLPLLMVVIGGVVVCVWRGGHVARRLSVAVSSMVILAVAYNVWVGGDAWDSNFLLNRYVSVVLPASLVPVVAGAAVLSRAVGPLRRWIPAAVVVVVAGVAVGMVSNPYRYVGRNAIAMVVATSVALLGQAGALHLRSRVRTGAVGASLVAIAAVTLVASIVTAFPMYRWATSGGLHVGDDQQKTQEGLALAAATDPSAVIATVWAGAPAYYASRTMVDLLGKSDRRIARMDVVGPFYPGHNKWDYSYSIGELRPDVVFQVWSTKPSDEEQLRAWGYTQGCLDVPGAQPSYFRVDSDKVRWAAVVACAGPG